MKFVVVDADVHLRVELMEEFKAGKHSKWDPNYEIGFWKEREVELAEGREEGDAARELSIPKVESPRTTENVQVEVVSKIGIQNQGAAKEPIIEHEGIAQN